MYGRTLFCLPHILGNRAIDRCIEENVLKDFLIERRSEVVKVMTLDYTFERRLLLEREEAASDGHALGLEQGLEQGRTEGELKTLVKNVEAAMKNFHISLKEACEGLGTTVEEYEKAKNYAS